MIIILTILLDYFQRIFKVRTKPKVLQIPIISRCNSRCQTCNIWKNKELVELDPQALKIAFKDKYFSKVEFVGLNGGEPTLYKNMEELLGVVLSLPNIKGISLITNSILTPRVLSMVATAKKICEKHHCKLSLTISVDGIGAHHDFVRGVPGSFKRTLTAIEAVLKDKEQYCDNFDLGCTISKHNVFYLAEIDAFFQPYQVEILYHLAAPIKRIGTFESHDYSVFSDPMAKMMAKEFFLGKYLSTKNKARKIRYFLSFHYLQSAKTKRLGICKFLYQDLTIDENLNLYLCAVASDKIGNLNDSQASNLIKSTKTKEGAKDIAQYCDSCIHYASYPNLEGLFIFAKRYVNDVLVWFCKYKFRAKWLR